MAKSKDKTEMELPIDDLATAPKVEAAMEDAAAAPEAEPSIEDEAAVPEAEPSIEDEAAVPEAEPSIEDEAAVPEAEPSIEDEAATPEAETAIENAVDENRILLDAIEKQLNAIGAATANGHVPDELRHALEETGAVTVADNGAVTVRLFNISAASTYGLHRALLDWCMAATRVIMSGKAPA